MFSNLSELPEIPAIVIKTRALLALRGFTVDELLEYEDRFVLHPTRESENGLLKYVVWILKEEKVVGVAIVRELVKEHTPSSG